MIDYDHFISQLRQDEASSQREQLQQFLKRFKLDGTTIPNQRKMISNFLNAMNKQSLQLKCFMEEDGKYDTENIQEGWEKLVLTKVFDIVFHGPKNEDKHTSQLLADKINTYYWIEERHLDLDINFSLSLEVVQAELLRINGFRAPRDKLVTLQNVMKLVVDLITKRTGKQGDACSDCILPTLILAIIRSNPQDIISNVKYITRFRNASDLEQGNNQFCMTSMMGAITFIYNMTTKSLTLSPEEQKQWPFENQNLNATKDEFKHFTEQVTGFFGQLITDVKTTANEVISSVQQPPGSGKDVFSAVSPFAPNLSPSSATPMVKHPNLKVVDEENEKTREDYELELAIAISLSEAQEGKFDIESYSPMHTKMDEQTP